MKKIYAFNFDGEECLTSKVRKDIRLIAYLLYDFIYSYDDVVSLNINKNIVYNRIHEGLNMNYYLDSDVYDDGLINYEPFLLGDKVFALTVNDELISEEEIKYLLNSVINMLKINGKVEIFSENYYSKNKDDEKCRSKAINNLRDKMGLRKTKKTDWVKKLVFGVKNKKNISCYGRY